MERIQVQAVAAVIMEVFLGMGAILDGEETVDIPMDLLILILPEIRLHRPYLTVKDLLQLILKRMERQKQ